jgi:poly(3-hydroxybutyrate) depolymerase
MKNTISTFRSALLVAALAFAPLTASLHAQTAERVQVNVPFDFQDGSKTFAAGLYTLSASSSGMILTIHGRDNSGLAMSRVEDSNSTAPTTGMVVFHRYGDKYFLSQVWQANESAHTVCIKTAAEIKAQKASQSQIASTKPATFRVEIAALTALR